MDRKKGQLDTHALPYPAVSVSVSLSVSVSMFLLRSRSMFMFMFIIMLIFKFTVNFVRDGAEFKNKLMSVMVYF